MKKKNTFKFVILIVALGKRFWKMLMFFKRFPQNLLGICKREVIHSIYVIRNCLTENTHYTNHSQTLFVSLSEKKIYIEDIYCFGEAIREREIS